MKGHETPHAVQCRGSDKNGVFVVRGSPQGANAGRTHPMLEACPAMRAPRRGAPEETEANPWIPWERNEGRKCQSKLNKCPKNVFKFVVHNEDKANMKNFGTQIFSVLAKLGSTYAVRMTSKEMVTESFSLLVKSTRRKCRTSRCK